MIQKWGGMKEPLEGLEKDEKTRRAANEDYVVKQSNAAGTFPESGVKYNTQNSSLQGRGTWDIHSEYVQKITMIIP